MTVNPINEKVGDNIRKARERAPMSQSRLAQLIGVAQSSASLYEQGKRGLTVIQIEKLCDALNVTPNYLFGIPDQVLGDSRAMRVADIMYAHPRVASNILLYAISAKDQELSQHIGMES